MLDKFSAACLRLQAQLEDRKLAASPAGFAAGDSFLTGRISASSAGLKDRHAELTASAIRSGIPLGSLTARAPYGRQLSSEIRTTTDGNPAVFSPLSPLAVPLLLKPLHLLELLVVTEIPWGESVRGLSRSPMTQGHGKVVN